MSDSYTTQTTTLSQSIFKCERVKPYRIKSFTEFHSLSLKNDLKHLRVVSQNLKFGLWAIHIFFCKRHFALLFIILFIIGFQGFAYSSGKESTPSRGLCLSPTAVKTSEQVRGWFVVACLWFCFCFAFLKICKFFI